MMKKIALALGCILFFISACTQQIPVRKERKISKQVVVSGWGVSYEESLHNAFKTAVNVALGVMVDSSTIVNNGQLIQDKILLLSKGYISKYDIIFAQKQIDGPFITKIRARVNDIALKNDLEKLNFAKGKKKVAGNQLHANIYSKRIQLERAMKTLQDLFKEYPKDWLITKEIISINAVDTDFNSSDVDIELEVTSYVNPKYERFFDLIPYFFKEKPKSNRGYRDRITLSGDQTNLRSFKSIKRFGKKSENYIGQYAGYAIGFNKEAIGNYFGRKYQNVDHTFHEFLKNIAMVPIKRIIVFHDKKGRELHRVRRTLNRNNRLMGVATHSGSWIIGYFNYLEAEYFEKMTVKVPVNILNQIDSISYSII